MTSLVVAAVLVVRPYSMVNKNKMLHLVHQYYWLPKFVHSFFVRIIHINANRYRSPMVVQLFFCFGCSSNRPNRRNNRFACPGSIPGPESDTPNTNTFSFLSFCDQHDNEDPCCCCLEDDKEDANARIILRSTSS